MKCEFCDGEHFHHPACPVRDHDILPPFEMAADEDFDDVRTDLFPLILGVFGAAVIIITAIGIAWKYGALTCS